VPAEGIEPPTFGLQISLSPPTRLMVFDVGSKRCGVGSVLNVTRHALTWFRWFSMTYKNDRRFRPNTVGNTALLAGPLSQTAQVRLHLFHISNILNQLGEPIALSADGVASDVTAGRCGHASAVDHVHTRAACLADLRDHAVRLRERRE